MCSTASLLTKSIFNTDGNTVATSVNPLPKLKGALDVNAVPPYEASIASKHN